MVINLDILILENSVINYFLLYITSQTVRIRAELKRMILSSVLGGIYVITLIYPKLSILTLMPFKIIVAFIMVFIMFKNKNLVFNLKAAAIYILYSMLLAGLCFFLELNNNPLTDLTSFKYNFTYKKLILAFIIAYLSISRLIIYIKDRNDINTLTYKVEIKKKDINKTITAFLDTGNELREPATNLPVMIVERKYLNDFKILDKEKLYIPYKVVSGQVGQLIGFKPDYINVHYENEIKKREVIIAFCDNKLSGLNDYEALLSRGII